MSEKREYMHSSLRWGKKATVELKVLCGKVQRPGNNKLIVIKLIARLCHSARCTSIKIQPVFSCNLAREGKKNRLLEFSMLYDFENNPSSCQSCCQNYCATVLSNRSMDSFQAQVLSDLKCMSSLLWNNNSLWSSLCPHHSMNCCSWWTCIYLAHS